MLLGQRNKDYEEQIHLVNLLGEYFSPLKNICLITAILVLLSSGKLAFAQTLYGSLVGTVTDQSGAVVQNASVTATEINTNTTRAGNTNEHGYYMLSTVPAGIYSVTITKQNFGTFKVENVSVVINATARVDAALSVGTQTATVSVSADTAQLETDRIDVHANVSSVELQELPQPTRTYEGALGLLPGIAPPSANSGGTNNPARSMTIYVNEIGRAHV